jgi:hypothetical protein
MYSTKNFGRTNTTGDARKSLVQKSHKSMNRSLVLQQEKEIASVALTRRLQRIQGSLEMVVIRVRIKSLEGYSLMVCCAPLSTKALTECPFTSTGMLPLVSEEPIHERHCILEHGHPPEAFWRIFDGMLQILQNGLLTYCLLDPPLCLDIKRIGIESSYL